MIRASFCVSLSVLGMLASTLSANATGPVATGEAKLLKPDANVGDIYTPAGTPIQIYAKSSHKIDVTGGVANQYFDSIWYFRLFVDGDEVDFRTNPPGAFGVSVPPRFDAQGEWHNPVTIDGNYTCRIGMNRVFKARTEMSGEVSLSPALEDSKTYNIGTQTPGGTGGGGA